MPPKAGAGGTRAGKKKKDEARLQQSQVPALGLPAAAQDDFDMDKEMSQALQRCNSKLSRSRWEAPVGSKKSASVARNLEQQFEGAAAVETPIRSPYTKKPRVTSPTVEELDTLREDGSEAGLLSRLDLVANEDDDMDRDLKGHNPKKSQDRKPLKSKDASPETHNPEKSMQEAHNPKKSMQEAHNPKKFMQEAHNPKKSMQEAHNPEKSMQEAHNPKKSMQEAHNPEKSMQQAHMPENMKEAHNPEKPVKEVHNPEKSVLEAHMFNPEKSQDPDCKVHQSGDGGTEVSQGTQQSTVASMPSPHGGQAKLNRPRHLDSQTTVSLADSKASPSRADAICLQLIDRGLPEPSDDDVDLPTSLMEFIFNQGVDTVGRMSDVDKAAAVVRWTRAIGKKQQSNFDLDPLCGYMAKELHGCATDLKNQQAILQKATTDYEKYMNVILGLGDKKRGELQRSETDLKKLGAGLDQISSWVEGKLRERQGIVASETEKAMQIQLRFASALECIMDVVQQECENRLAAVDETVTMDLECQLQALMLETQGADEAAGHASPPGAGDPQLLAVKDEAPSHDDQPVASTATPASTGTEDKPVASPKQTEPGTAVADVEDPLASAEAAKEAKRLAHNARVTFDRRIKGGDCPPAILDKVQSFQGQPNRLKLLQALFHDWHQNGGDWMRTAAYQESERRTSDESKGKQKMISFKALKEKYGKKLAERIRDNKKQQEGSRNAKVEPRPFWFKHPDWEMYRCFDSLEFELKDVSSSSTGFSSRANLGPEASSQLASTMQDMVLQPGAKRAEFGLGGQAALLPSNSTESLQGQQPDGNKQGTKKVNAFGLTRKLNSKIQAIAAKQTEIFVWTRKIEDSTAEGMSEKTKEGFNDQLSAKKADFDALKSKMEALYSSCSQVMDKDLTTEQQTDIANLLQAAETLSNDLNGSLRPIKMTLVIAYVQPFDASSWSWCRLIADMQESFTSARQSLQAMKEEMMKNYGLKMTGPCAKLEAAGAHGKWGSNIQRDMLRTSSTGDDVPIDMVDVPIKPEQGKLKRMIKSMPVVLPHKLELSLGMDTIAAYMGPVVASFNLLVEGVQVCRYGESLMVHGMCTEIRGDWKWQKEFTACLFS
ncbi:unnamed protein product [Symbiodinium sp. CCMP2592]|nr:unnamed protein product [Symbiodinium sp. CCMP2592]